MLLIVLCVVMMIEYMAAVILTGCGPEVCVTLSNTQHELKRQTEEDGSPLRRWWKWEQYGEKREKMKRKRHRYEERRQTEEAYRENYPLKL